MKSFKTSPWVLPQPVLIIGTYNENGVANAMSAAWGGQWEANQITISLSAHATTDNIVKNNGEFTVTFATKETAVAADFVGLVSAKNCPEKIAKTGWTVEKAPSVNAPVFTNFPMTLECRMTEKIENGGTGFHVVAEIVNILVDEKYLAEDGKPAIEKMNLIVFDPMHMGYVQLGERVGNAFSDGNALK